MSKTLGALAMAMLVLAGCSSGEEGGDDISAPTDPQTAFENAFAESFHREFVSTCSSGSAQQGLDRAVAVAICTCAADALVRDFEVSELASVSEAQLGPIMNQCINENAEQRDG